MSSKLPKPRADALAAHLDLSLDGVCFACLSFVSFAVERGDEREIRRQLRAMTPDLWADGLDVSALAAVRVACARGVRDGPAALAELQAVGSQSAVARAIVRRLAEELVRRTRLEIRLEERARPRLSLAPPELN
jgi:hypothetical protein